MQYQSYICGKNHWLLEPDLKAILSKHWPDLPKHEAALIDFGAVAGGRAYEVAEHIDRGFEITFNHLKQGHCPWCQRSIAGVWRS